MFLIFIGALVVYFISARNTMEKESAVYTSMEEPSLPVVYTQLGGQEINCLHGYMQDMGIRQPGRVSLCCLKTVGCISGLKSMEIPLQASVMK